MPKKVQSAYNKSDMAVALGDDIDIIAEIENEPESIEGKIAWMSHIMKQHTISLDSIFTLIKEMRNNDKYIKNADKSIEAHKDNNKIPVGTVLIGMSKGIPFWCVVKADGFHVGITKYDSLSAAAEGVSGVRRSGLTFWKFNDGNNSGRSIKEVYKGQ